MVAAAAKLLPIHPEGVEVRSWPGEQPPGHPEEDAIWIISTDRPPDSNLLGVVISNLELGYRLTSVEQVAISVGRIFWAGYDSAAPLQIEGIPFTAGEGTIQVSFTFDSDRLEEESG